MPFENAAVPTYSLVAARVRRSNVRLGAVTLHGVDMVVVGELAVERVDDRTVIVNGRLPPELFGVSFGRLCRPPPHFSTTISQSGQAHVDRQIACQSRSTSSLRT